MVYEIELEFQISTYVYRTRLGYDFSLLVTIGANLLGLGISKGEKLLVL